MTRLFIYSLLLYANIIFAQNREWHVIAYPTQAENQTLTTGNGTSSNPWALQNALNNPNGVIKPGDTIWLHGGDYKGHFTSSSNLLGNSTNYITISSYPGQWARIDGNIYPYVSPPQGLPDPNYDPNNDPNYFPASVDEEMNSYLSTEEEDSIAVLIVQSNYIIYKDFEITCLGNINRQIVTYTNQTTHVTTNCEPSNGFHKFVGISHSSSTTNKYVNLVIRNMPGEGIGSWKNTANTEIYGCIIYNNGYINKAKINSCNTNSTYTIIGKGPGIYSQNESPTQKRKIKNNIFSNNYDSGLFIWSSTSAPSFDFLRNFDVVGNIFINNGGPQRDETANLIVKSNSTNTFNHPKDITVNNNIFYLNSRSSFISGIDMSNCDKVDIQNNYILKGTAGVKFTSNNKNLTFKNNLYFGKRLQTLIFPNDYLNNNWEMDYNNYHTRFDSTDMFHIQFASNGNNIPAVFYTLPQFQSLYSDELHSTKTQNYEINSGNLRMGSSATPTKIFITQNEYNPNVFYVTIFNPRSDLPQNNNINVDFSSYNITNGRLYRIIDAENCFGNQISGNLTSNTISFPMNLSAIEQPIGVYPIDYTTPVVHTFEDLSVFIVEFLCENLAFDKVLQNITETGTNNIEAKMNVTLGTNYETNSGSNIIVKAGKNIEVISNSHFKSGSDILLKIENTCPDIVYNQSQQSRISSESNIDDLYVKSNDNLIIYPNPATHGVLYVETAANAERTIAIYDVLGKNVLNTTTSNSEVNISALKGGVYIVKITEEGKTATKKLIIK